MSATTQRAEIDVLIGQRVHHVLWRRKIQQRELAAALGITQSTLSRRLRGESAWFAGDLVALAEALDVSVGWLFGEDSVARPKGLEPLTFWSVLCARFDPRAGHRRRRPVRTLVALGSSGVRCVSGRRRPRTGGRAAFPPPRRECFICGAPLRAGDGPYCHETCFEQLFPSDVRADDLALAA